MTQWLVIGVCYYAIGIAVTATLSWVFEWTKKDGAWYRDWVGWTIPTAWPLVVLLMLASVIAEGLLAMKDDSRWG